MCYPTFKAIWPLFDCIGLIIVVAASSFLKFYDYKTFRMLCVKFPNDDVESRYIYIVKNDGFVLIEDGCHS